MTASGGEDGAQTAGRKILVVEDDRSMRESLMHLLDAAGWVVAAIGDPTQAIAALAGFSPDVILSDVRMPKLSGLALLRALPEGAPPMVLISAHGDIPTAVEAMGAGAYSFMEKPFDPRRLLNVLKNAADRHRLSQDAARLRQRLRRLSGLDRVLLGQSAAIAELREQVIDYAEAAASVLILGETGTGKELVARALHDLGPRAAKPFAALNCAMISDETFEARVFGVSGGEPGAMASADGGTLFLDALGACSAGVQAKFLRAADRMEIHPIGAGGPQRVDLRWIAAASDPLETAAAEGRFREDLLYRLGALILRLPPLRERREDIPLLFEHFVGDYAALYEIDAPEATAEDLTAMMAYDWPGNVRELRNIAERRVLAAKRGRGSVAGAIGRDADLFEAPETLREAVAAFERQLIAKAIRAHAGRMDAVAASLGIGRRTLNEKIVKLGLDKSKLL